MSRLSKYSPFVLNGSLCVFQILWFIKKGIHLVTVRVLISDFFYICILHKALKAEITLAGGPGNPEVLSSRGVSSSLDHIVSLLLAYFASGPKNFAPVAAQLQQEGEGIDIYSLVCSTFPWEVRDVDLNALSG